MSKENNIISSFESLILIKVSLTDNSVFNSDFEYISGSFDKLGFTNFNNFNQLLDSIYESAPICEGIGYYEYLNQIRESVYFCYKENKKSSFIIPIRKDGVTHYFMMNINKKDDSLFVLFIYFNQDNNLLNFEDFTTGTFKDALTGLFNYKTLVEHISENKRRGYLCLFDLNKFKDINDKYGHEIGDKVLQDIANYMISIASMKEVFYRRSGDEFIILIFEQDMNYTLKLINDIEKTIESIPNRLKRDFRCSAAFGILELSDKELISYEKQSKLIDLAMYQAKTSKKLYHYISHEDAMSIIAKGDLEQRIKEIANKIRR